MTLRKGADIAELLLEQAAIALRESERLPDNPRGRHVGFQWVRAATSAAANYEEARGAESRDDFIHKVFTSLKECRESCLWMNTIRVAGWIGDLGDARAKGDKACALLAASVRTARNNAASDKTARR
jgi:four helix bundle protein